MADLSTSFDLGSPTVCIVGPTATGKSDVAQELALFLEGEVVSADSMQIYEGMDIGTGKVPPSERKVPHHGIDLCLPGTDYSAALYQKYARACFKDIANRGKRAILCGGTGLYVRAALDDYDFPQGNQEDNPIRQYYTDLAEMQGNQAVWDLLNKKDPSSAQLIHPHNTRRVIRAFEMLNEGTSYAHQRKKLDHIPQIIPAYFLGLSVTPELLVKRIDTRVERMVEEGLVDEVKGLLQKGFRKGITSAQAIGYKEIVQSLEGLVTIDEAIERIKIATHRYAKRQRTWFRKDKRIHWLDADSGDTEEVFCSAKELLDKIESKHD